MPHAKAERIRFEELLRSKLVGICQLAPEQVERLYGHYALLQRWNRVLNLTSVRDLDTAVVRHYCESLFLAANLPRHPFSLADLGSGGGFPGIPVAVARPDCTVTLIESHQRKAVFLKEAARSVPNVKVIAKRAEEVEEAFDWATLRAVACEDVMPFIAKLAANLALLVGAEDAMHLTKAECIRLDPPVALPWGRRSVLILGHCVSRGT